MDKLMVTRWGNMVFTAQLSEGKIVQLMAEPDSSVSILGNIYVGKVQKVVKNIEAAFIEIAPGFTGYYSIKEEKGGKDLRPGDELAVQICRDSVKTKAPVLTGSLSLTGRFCVVTEGGGQIHFSSKLRDEPYKAKMCSLLEGAIKDGSFRVIVRTNACQADDEAVLNEVLELKERLCHIREESSRRTCFQCLYQAEPAYIGAIRDSFAGTLSEIITDVPEYYEELQTYLRENQREDAGKLSFYEDPLLPLSKLYRLEHVLEQALGTTVWLKSGGYLVIEPTEAMTVIDVNTGKYSGKKTKQNTILQINMEAAAEIGRQLRLRNLSGIVIVDFIDMERQEDRQALFGRLKEILSRDRIKTAVVDMTALNLVEITRKKVRKPLREQVSGLKTQ